MTDIDAAAVARTIAAAEHEVRRLGHAEVGTEHLLLGLLADEFSDVAALLRRAGVTASATRHMVAEVVVAAADTAAAPGAPIDLTARARRAVDRAGRFSRRALADEVTDEHLLLGLLDVEGLACQVLRRLDVDPEQLRAALDGAGTAAEHERVAEPESVAEGDEGDEGEAGAPAGPDCGRCGAALDTALTRTTVVAGDGVPVVVVHCGECGAALGVAAP